MRATVGELKKRNRVAVNRIKHYKKQNSPGMNYPSLSWTYFKLTLRTENGGF